MAETGVIWGFNRYSVTKPILIELILLLLQAFAYFSSTKIYFYF